MGLSRREIIDAALGILDAYGLADLTMRRLATCLGVQAGALYWHFANKQTLLAALSDEILTELPALDEDDWPIAARRWATSLHQLLRRHRSGAELVSGVVAMRSWAHSPALPLEQLLVSQGVSATTARATASGVLSLVLGHTWDEEQAAQYSELGVGDGMTRPGSAELLDQAVELLLVGAEARR